jgi:P-type E1-E2 ATPase
MIAIDIPGFKKIEADHLVLDFNGTLAIDGKLIEGTRNLLKLLANDLIIHILTADTFGTAKKELMGIDCTLNILESTSQDRQKAKYTLNLGKEKTVAIGNGLNDALMLKNAILGIAVIQKEGASVKSISNADIVCHNIVDALELLIYQKRIVATLRK